MNVIIVGAGPTGLFLAHRLLARNPSYKVKIYESNKNPIDLEYCDSKEFGLGLGARIQNWFKSIDGLEEQLVSQGINFPSGLILIPRRQLCALLLRSRLTLYGERESNENSRLWINFNTPVVNVDSTHREIIIDGDTGSEKVPYNLLIGADEITQPSEVP